MIRSFRKRCARLTRSIILRGHLSDAAGTSSSPIRTFSKAAVARFLNCRNVDKHVLTTLLRLNKSITLGHVDRHFRSPPQMTPMIRSAVALRASISCRLSSAASLCLGELRATAAKPETFTLRWFEQRTWVVLLWPGLHHLDEARRRPP
jgi:hypothetical protein